MARLTRMRANNFGFWLQVWAPHFPCCWTYYMGSQSEWLKSAEYKVIDGLLVRPRPDSMNRKREIDVRTTNSTGWDSRWTLDFLCGQMQRTKSPPQKITNGWGWGMFPQIKSNYRQYILEVNSHIWNWWKVDKQSRPTQRSGADVCREPWHLHLRRKSEGRKAGCATNL